ncbi:MAG: potassium channel family protein [Gemmatimonadetes bacterium]|nr:potassium channel family protein [Gemmatimonadota bacterium]
MHQESNGRFRFLFAALMILVAVMPFLRPGALGAGILQVLFTLLLFSGLYAVSDGKRALVVASAFAGPALVFLWAGRFMVNTALDGIGALLLAGFLVFTATEILKYIVRARRVTSELIFGAVCVYLMMGIVGALLFAVLDLWSPGSLALPAGAGSGVGDATHFSAVAYYSFVTLTTLGYGDITPVSRLARSLSTMEAVTGQLYLAVLVARMVGLQIAHSTPASD